MWLGSSQQLAKLDITHVRVLSSCVAVQDTARDLGVVIDSQLSLSAHVTAVCGIGYYQLRQLQQAVLSLCEDASKTLVGVRFLSPGLLQLSVLRHLVRTDEPVAVGSQCCRPLVTGTRCSDHITPVLRQLHWLPVRQRVDFNVAKLVHRVAVLHFVIVPSRLVADPRERRLRSTASRTGVVTRTYSTFDDRAFAAAGPRLWNSLPSHLKEAHLSYNRFRRWIKTFLFG